MNPVRAMTCDKFFIDDITSSENNGALLVRVMRVWKPTNKFNPAETTSIEMVLVDSKGSTIEAQAKKQSISKFEPMIREGHTKLISNYGVTMNYGSWRARHNWKIQLYRSRHVKVANPFDIFPYPVFNFEPFENQGGNEKIKVLLWDDHAQHVVDYLGPENKTDVVLIVQFVKYGTWNGQLSITTSKLNGKIYIDSDMDAIRDFNERMDNSNNQGDSEKSLSLLSIMTSYGALETFMKDAELRTVDGINNIGEGTTSSSNGDVVDSELVLEMENIPPVQSKVVDDEEDNSSIKKKVVSDEEDVTPDNKEVVNVPADNPLLK
ncbi:OLC1v1005142C1 [Oldenlandia corymbosa var. corymbosa]|uniref:OLC1v1005142C1 n=1 Tax=Oldenlandia corymbosa var. corymbosa TaxID=529605 RepID=A0AAV1DE23_OLDCO|nr:OLC1v1005142C1 [Oldenlandia corymbosa var. corymbosa]